MNANPCFVRNVALALAVALSAPALAEETGDTFEEVIVTATRMPAPVKALPNRVTLIDDAALENQLAISTSLLDALGVYVPSFAPTRQKLTGSSETLRGREPLYMIDGVPQSNPLRNGQRDGFTLDPAVIERIEVLYGANAIQGIGATGGIVNYITRSARSNPGTSLEVSVNAEDSGGSDGRGGRASLTTANKAGAFDWLLSAASERRGAFYDAKGRRVGVDNVQGDIQDSQSLNLFAKLGWDIGERTRLQFMANAFELEGDGDYVPTAGDRDAGIPVSSVRGSFPGEAPFNDVLTASLDLSHEFLRAGSLDAQLYYQDFEAVYGGGVFGVFQDPALDASGQLFDQSGNNSEKHGLKLTWTHSELPVDGLTATLGLDFLADSTFQELIQTGRLWVPETEFRSTAPFIQLSQSLVDDRLSLSGGARFENMELKVDTYSTLASYGPQVVDGGSPDFDETLYNLGASFALTDSLTVYGTYAEGFTVPDVGRVLRGVSTPGSDVDDLLDLQPIIADNTEFGLKWSGERWTCDIAVFRSHSDFGQRLQPDADGIFSVKRERTEIEGVELAADFAATSELLLGFNYAHIDGRFDSNADGRVDRDLTGLNVSPDRLNAYAEWRARPNLSLRAQSSTFFDTEFDDAGDATDFSGYTLVDAVLGWDTARFGRFDFAVSNLFNRDYITYYSQSATTSNSRYFAGRGRTFTLRWLKHW